VQEIKVDFNYKKLHPQKKIKIGFINPPGSPTHIFQPMTFLYMESHYKRHGKYSDFVEWIEPIYKWDEVTYLEDVANHIYSYDMVFFSSYVWNYTICDKIASLAKIKNPNLICVMGGPQIGLNIPSIFDNRFKYDFISQPMKPGETFAMDLIDSYFDNNGTPNYDNISWELRSKKQCGSVEFEYSVYEDHFNFVKKLSEYKKEKNLLVGILFETTKGCPFSCVFCEWGGGTGEKVIKKPMDIIKKDLLTISKAGWDVIEMGDANFGMYKERDIEWLDFALQNNIRPQGVSFVKLKNYKKKEELFTDVFNTVKKYKNGTNEYGQFISVGASIQTVSDEAIKIADRVDLTFEEKIKLAKHAGNLLGNSETIENFDLILAMPGSTLEDFYNEYEIIWESKSNFPRYVYLFLPDSPSSNKEYLKKYDIKLLEVHGNFLNADQIPKNSFYKDVSFSYHTHASSFSATNEEMKQMWIMNNFGFSALNTYYYEYQNKINPKTFVMTFWEILQMLPEFKEIKGYADRLYNPDDEPLNVYEINGVYVGNYVTNLFVKRNQLIKIKLERLFNEQLAAA
jgi:radical SAM superfamily enzyme YgiQ (UPF0313 family)